MARSNVVRAALAGAVLAGLAALPATSSTVRAGGPSFGLGGRTRIANTSTPRPHFDVFDMKNGVIIRVVPHDLNFNADGTVTGLCDVGVIKGRKVIDRESNVALWGRAKTSDISKAIVFNDAQAGLNAGVTGSGTVNESIKIAGSGGRSEITISISRKYGYFFGKMEQNELSDDGLDDSHSGAPDADDGDDNEGGDDGDDLGDDNGDDDGDNGDIDDGDENDDHGGDADADDDNDDEGEDFDGDECDDDSTGTLDVAGANLLPSNQFSVTFKGNSGVKYSGKGRDFSGGFQYFHGSLHAAPSSLVSDGDTSWSGNAVAAEEGGSAKSGGSTTVQSKFYVAGADKPGTITLRSSNESAMWKAAYTAITSTTQQRINSLSQGGTFEGLNSYRHLQTSIQFSTPAFNRVATFKYDPAFIKEWLDAAK